MQVSTFVFLAALVPLAFAANVTDLVRQLTADRGYDHRFRPNYGSGRPVEVGVTLHILGFSAISDSDQDYTVEMYFRQRWNDSRLIWPESIKSQKWPQEKSQEGSQEPQGPIPWDSAPKFIASAALAKAVWMPDTFFTNAKRSHFHFATTPNAFLRLYPDGGLFHSTRLTNTFSCAFDYGRFPFDSPKCWFRLESYGFDASDLYYLWSKGNNSVSVSDDLPTGFRLMGHRIRSSRIALSSGEYSALSVDVAFDRKLGYFVLRNFLPAALVVVLSWVAFWLGPRLEQARVGLGLAATLALVFLGYDFRAALPQVATLTAFDVYFVGCLLVVLAAFLESVVVVVGEKKADVVYTEVNSKPLLEGGFCRKVSLLDDVSKKAFPIVFVLFNAIYWTCYLATSGGLPEGYVEFRG